MSIIYLLNENIKNKNLKYINIELITLSGIMILLNMYNYNHLGIMNKITMEQNKIYCQQINQIINNYEITTGISVKKMSFCGDISYQNTYLNMPNNTFTTKGLAANYSALHCFNYYTGRKLQPGTMTEEQYNQFFLNKDWKEFNEEQIKFENEEVYICIY